MFKKNKSHILITLYEKNAALLNPLFNECKRLKYIYGGVYNIF